MVFETNLNQNDLTALWAALAAMVQDVHAPQDNLTDEQWTAAEALWSRLDNEVNRRASVEKAKQDLTAALAEASVRFRDVPLGSIVLDRYGAPVCVWPVVGEFGNTCSYGNDGPMWAPDNRWSPVDGDAKVPVLRAGGLTEEQCRWVMTPLSDDIETDYVLIRRKLAHLEAGGTPESFGPANARESSAA